MESRLIADELGLVYRDLIGAEAKLGETLSRRGIHVGATIADQWPTLHDYLNLYGRGLTPAGVVVFGGRHDDGSRATGIPFTGAKEARELLGLQTQGDARSPSAAAFWRAVATARTAARDAPLEALMGTVHLAQALPFDFSSANHAASGAMAMLAKPSMDEPEVREASARHVLRVLDAARPQAAICVGADALAGLGRALRNSELIELAQGREDGWIDRWPPGTRLSAHPYAEVPIKRPFRLRILALPSLTGAHAAAAEAKLVHAFSYVLA